MPQPDRTALRRRLAVFAAVIVVVLFVGALIAKPYLDKRAQQAAQDDAPRTLQIETPPLPVPPPPLSRADVVLLAERAASAFATGAPPPEQNAELVGRGFSVLIPFGCEGPRPADGPAAGAYWELDAARGTITLRAHPQVWTKAEWVRQLAAPAELDAAEGFWVPRPWILSEDCARAAPPPAEGEEAPPPPKADPTLGLAMFFAPNSSRVQQRGGRPYEYVGNAPADGAAVAPKGFRLVLGGRIASFESGEPVRCRANPNGRPTCLVAVEFDQVAFEDPASGKTLAEWRNH